MKREKMDKITYDREMDGIERWISQLHSRIGWWDKIIKQYQAQTDEQYIQKIQIGIQNRLLHCKPNLKAEFVYGVNCEEKAYIYKILQGMIGEEMNEIMEKTEEEREKIFNEIWQRIYKTEIFVRLRHTQVDLADERERRIKETHEKIAGLDEKVKNLQAQYDTRPVEAI